MTPVREVLAAALTDWFPQRDEGDEMTAEMADYALSAIPDGWAKVDGEWVRIKRRPAYDLGGVRSFQEVTD